MVDRATLCTMIECHVEQWNEIGNSRASIWILESVRFFSCARVWARALFDRKVCESTSDKHWHYEIISECIKVHLHSSNVSCAQIVQERFAKCASLRCCLRYVAWLSMLHVLGCGLAAWCEKKTPAARAGRTYREQKLFIKLILRSFTKAREAMSYCSNAPKSDRRLWSCMLLTSRRTMSCLIHDARCLCNSCRIWTVEQLMIWGSRVFCGIVWKRLKIWGSYVKSSFSFKDRWSVE